MTKFTPEYLADYVEIRELSARYNLYANAGDGESYAQLFTEDGEFHSGGHVYKGRAELARVAGSVPEIVHITTDPIIDVDGDEATQYSQKVSAHRALDKTSNTFVGTGTYVDQLVRTELGWR